MKIDLFYTETGFLGQRKPIITHFEGTLKELKELINLKLFEQPKETKSVSILGARHV